MLRTKLTFDQLVGKGIQYGADDQTIVQTIHGHRSWSSALCSNHVMRSGRHIAVFTILARRGSMAGIGVVRPVKIDKSDFVGDDLTFDPERMPKFLEYLRGKKTDKWGDSNVHCCTVNNYGSFCWHDLTGGDHHSGKSQIGLLLDLNEGTLSIHKDGRRIALKDNLTGEYCWYATVNHRASDSPSHSLRPGTRAARSGSGPSLPRHQRVTSSHGLKHRRESGEMRRDDQSLEHCRVMRGQELLAMFTAPTGTCLGRCEFCNNKGSALTLYFRAEGQRELADGVWPLEVRAR
ncbi:hypothetical protein THAOC_07629, partial [Thalassiosira oceanica]